MIDIFLSQDVKSLLQNKYIVFMGDSNVRALYKDFLCLLKKSQLISEANLKAKMENSLYGDKLTFHGKRTDGRNYREEREINSHNIHASFYFLTRVFDDYVKDALKRITYKRKPDVLVINCCLWDVTRWGATGVADYKLNLTHLLKHLKDLLPDCLVIWVTAPPISCEVKGGFLVQELQFLKYSLRFHVVEANHFARKVVIEHGFDVVDSHYHLKMQIHRRTSDGIHWLPPAVRYISNLLFTHISLAWGVPLPHRYKSSIMEENLEKLDDEVSTGVPVQENKIPVQAPANRVAIKAQSIAAKPDKENCDTPTPKRKRQSRRGKKPFRGASHHAYLNRVQHKERCMRIRQWQNTVPSNYSENSCHQSPPNPQHDSGYFPSPSEAYLSNESLHSSQRNIAYSSPQCSRTFNYENYLSPPLAQSPWRPPLPFEPYYSELPPLPKEPYPFSPRARFGYGRTLLPEPYPFPPVAQGQMLRPTMDFTSDDFMGF